MIELLDDSARAGKLGETALRRVSSRFTRDSMIERLAGVYDQVARPSRRGAHERSSRLD